MEKHFTINELTQHSIVPDNVVTHRRHVLLDIGIVSVEEFCLVIAPPRPPRLFRQGSDDFETKRHALVTFRRYKSARRKNKG